MKNALGILVALSRFLFLIIILVSAFLYAMFQGGKVSWTVFYMILPFILYSGALFFYPLSSIAAERIIRTPIVKYGGRLAVSISINRRFRFPLLYMVATDKFADPGTAELTDGKQKHLFIFGMKNKVEWDYEIEQMPRGEHILEGVEIELSDFFGWIRKKHFIPLKQIVLVYPKISDVNYIPMDTQYDRGTMASPLNLVKDTTMATGIRDYQSGDRVSWIHWKSFARTQTLMTKEFEDRRSQELIVVLDSRPSEVFEEQVELAASIVMEASAHQAGLGFVTTGNERLLTPFIQSDGQLQHALIHLAKLKPSGDSTTGMSSHQASELKHGGSIILITANPNWAFIQSILENAGNVRSFTCLTVLKENGEKNGHLLEDIRIAKLHGVTVRTLTQKQFPEAFKEVTHL
ncbi:DUF58 domain-containing protein [Sporosarcina siberiensis]|uniref:DUF58 domain-containing protein n=1 Tax=Sporosarcina siberiensis TaxID=1365606 RepID=A0ABW4SIX5_9BACL